MISNKEQSTTSVESEVEQRTDPDRQPREVLRREVRDLRERAAETGREALESAREARDEAEERLKQRARELVNRQRDRAADSIQRYVRAIRHAADQLREEEDAMVAHYAQRLARALELSSDYVRGTNLRDVRQRIESLTRQHPELVLGGMFVVGLAASRFLKTTPERSTNESGVEAEWQDEAAYAPYEFYEQPEREESSAYSGSRP